MTARETLNVVRSLFQTMDGYLKDMECGRPVNPTDVSALGIEIARYTRVYQERLAAELMERAA